ncbi:hypothetical protein [Labrys monachus]|uniref:Uncharacterized protein n=1 Tax=Labrys monachus TaxID=217067 RepID=A0ABU0F719_9HYPH|nr:hypothetical protein [Labrys monachus]MDQ0390412.1 hypothetical protein [Labrys monachus]
MTAESFTSESPFATASDTAHPERRSPVVPSLPSPFQHLEKIMNRWKRPGLSMVVPRGSVVDDRACSKLSRTSSPSATTAGARARPPRSQASSPDATPAPILSTPSIGAHLDTPLAGLSFRNEERTPLNLALEEIEVAIAEVTERSQQRSKGRGV